MSDSDDMKCYNRFFSRIGGAGKPIRGRLSFPDSDAGLERLAWNSPQKTGWVRRAAHSKSARKRANSPPRGFSRELGAIGMLKKVGLALGAIGLAAGLAAQGTPAQAQSGVRVGTLNCNVASGWGFVLGSSRALRCVFSGAGRAPEHYTGTISKFGVDIGYTQGGVLVWAVLAPTTNVAPGSLAGNFAGATASATVGVGAGANVLIGGSNQSISLQPLSIEGNTGLNVAAGIGAITLHHVR